MAEEEEEVIVEEGEENEEEGEENEEGDFLETINEESFDNCYKRTRRDFIELVTFGKQFFPSFQEPSLENTIKYINLAESILSQLDEQQYKQCTLNIYKNNSKDCVNCCGCGK